MVGNDGKFEIPTSSKRRVELVFFSHRFPPIHIFTVLGGFGSNVYFRDEGKKDEGARDYPIPILKILSPT